MANPSSHCWRSRKSLAAGRKSSGGSAPSSPPNAPESSRARVPAPSPLPETSTTTTSSRSRSGGPAVTTKSPANGVPPAERRAASAWKPTGSVGMVPWLWMRSRRSTSIDSPRTPATPSRLRRNEVSRMMKPAMNSTTTPPTSRGVMSVSCDIVPTMHSRTKTMNHGRCRGPSDRLPRISGSTSAVTGTYWGQIQVGIASARVSATSVEQRPVALGRAAAQRGVGRAAEAGSPGRTPVVGAHVGRHCTARERNFG